MINKSKQYGQYFTPLNVARFMTNMITKSYDANVLEPCAGKGVFLRALSENNYNNIIAYEIDDTLINRTNIIITYDDFLNANIKDEFDVIIGNPPYVRWKNIPDIMKESFNDNSYWNEKINGLSDLLYAFIYRCIDLLKKDGELIFITPSFWTETLHPQFMRMFMMDNGYIDTIIFFNEMKIFPKVSSSIMIFKYVKNKIKIPMKVIFVDSKDKLNINHIEILKKLLKRLDNTHYIKEDIYEAFYNNQYENGELWKPIPPMYEPLINDIEKICIEKAPNVKVIGSNGEISTSLTKLYRKNDLVENNFPLSSFKKVKLNNELYYYSHDNYKLRYTSLGDIADIGNGLVSGLDKAFKINNILKYTEEEKTFVVKVIKAKNINKYYALDYTPYIFVNNINDEILLENKLVNIYKKLRIYKSKLLKRYSYKKDIPWWHWVFLRNYDLIKNNKEKILVPCKERYDHKGYVRFAYAKGDYLATQDVTVIVKKKIIKEDIKYILAILNSTLIFTWLKYKSLKRGGVLEFSERPLTRIPIRLINWQDETDVNLHNDIVHIVSEIIEKKDLDLRKSVELENIIKQLYEIK